MKSLPLALFCLLLSMGLPAQSQTHEATMTRVQALVSGYGDLVNELKLAEAPGDRFDYPLVTERLDELGEKLETLSRLAGRSETLTAAEWEQLDHQAGELTELLRTLRRLSLPLRVWGHYADEDHKPEWGLALDPTLQPQPQAKGAADGTPGATLQIAALPGQTVYAQVLVVPLTRDLGEIKVTPRDLSGPAGVIKAQAVRCDPLNYERLPQTTVTPGEQWWRGRLLLTRPSVPRDLTQAYMIAVAMPADARPGIYTGAITFAPSQVKSGTLHVLIQIDDKPAGEVKP